MFTLTTYLLQRTVLHQVQSEGPGREGNLFMLDIRNSAEVSRLVESQPGVTGKVQLVGYIVSRMLEQNGVPVDRLQLTARRKDDLQTVRITSAKALPDGLSKSERDFGGTADSARPQLAVSEQSAARFSFAPRRPDGVSDCRAQSGGAAGGCFRREQRAPVRFELVFPLRALEGLPVVYYGAAHVDPPRIPAVEEAIFENFPTVTVMNLADVLTRIQEAVDQVALVVRFLALFAIRRGRDYFCSSVAGTRYRRVREVAVLKTLGGTRRRIKSIFSIEFSDSGRGWRAWSAAACEFVHALSLREKFIEARFEFDWRSLLIAMAATALLANLAGWLASAGILESTAARSAARRIGRSQFLHKIIEPDNRLLISGLRVILCEVIVQVRSAYRVCLSSGRE